MLFPMELKLMSIVWDHAPLTASHLSRLAADEIGWKRTTTYTVIKRLSERGVIKSENAIVTSIVSKEEAQQSELEELMDKKFEGSLPAFIAAFGKRQALSDAEIEEIRKIIER